MPEKDNKLGLIVMMAVVIIVGVVLLGVIADNTYTVTRVAVNHVNTTVPAVKNITGVYVTGYGDGRFHLDNITNAINSSNNVTINSGNYTFTSAGLLKSTSTNCSSAAIPDHDIYFCGYDWKVTYSYVKDESSTTNTIILLIPLFYAIGVLVLVIVILNKFGILELFKK